MLKDNLPVLEGIGSEADFEKYGDSLGWFDIDTWANEAELSAIEELAARVRRDADVFVLIGVGGSNNAARSLKLFRNVMGRRSSMPAIHCHHGLLNRS